MTPAVRRIRPKSAHQGSATRRTLVGAAALCGAVTLLPGSPAADATPDGPIAKGRDRWSPPQQVSAQCPVGNQDAVIASSASGRRVTAVWSGCSGRNEPFGLQAASSADHGRTWSAPALLSERVSTDDQYLNGSRVASSRDGRVIVVMWTESRRRAADSHAYSVASADGGRTWTAARRLSTADGRARGGNTDLALSGDGRRAVAVWRQRTVGGGSLFAARTRNGGLRWSRARPIVTGRGLQTPQLAASADITSIAVAWAQRKGGLTQIHVARARNGLRLDPPTVISRGADDPSEYDARDGAWEPRAVASSNGRRVSVLWRETAPGPFDDVIATSSSGDGGTTWTPRRLLFTEGHGEDPSLAGAADGSALVAGWEGYVGQPLLGYGAFAAVSRDGGLTWAPPQVVPARQGDETEAVSSADGKRQAIVSSSESVRVSRSDDSGGTWQRAAPVSTPQTGFQPRLVSSADGLRLTAVWEHYRSATIWVSSLDLRPAAR